LKQSLFWDGIEDFLVPAMEMTHRQCVTTHNQRKGKIMANTKCENCTEKRAEPGIGFCPLHITFHCENLIAKYF